MRLVMMLILVGMLALPALADDAQTVAKLRAEVAALKAENAKLKAQLAAQSKEAQVEKQVLTQKVEKLSQQRDQMAQQAAKARKQQTDTFVLRRFDDKTNRTTVATRYRQLQMTRGSAAEHWCSISFDHVGRTLSEAPTSIRVEIQTAFSGKRYQDIEQVKLIADGKPVMWQVTDYDRKRRRTMGRNKRDISDESLVATMTRDDLRTLANARQVTGNIGHASFELDRDLLAALTVLHQQASPPTPPAVQK